MTATPTTASRTRPTVDPWIQEMLSPPIWRWRLTVPAAVMAARGHHAVAQALAEHGAHPLGLQSLAAGRTRRAIFSSMGGASAAAAARAWMIEAE
ncbi:hypothetical protein [Synechococcus sp. CBW1107]|uniref:hypothetical protein n=1 Tax=Synechococcus sp. CBW1107 TaxID=2789857 RepID=UPI002AD2AB96|nr:hypothetical protein [Synechococcus sp. CBW1107]CAK6692520.1 hypothetical protein ICNINCKA_01229 [Synechococcus sp. CBW1107]